MNLATRLSPAYEGLTGSYDSHLEQNVQAVMSDRRIGPIRSMQQSVGSMAGGADWPGILTP